MNRKRSTLVVTLVSLMAVLVVSPPAPTRADGAEKTEKTEKTERKVSLKITFPDGKWVKARSTEGGVIRLQRDGEDLGLTPVISETEDGVVEVSISRFKGPRAVAPAGEIEKVKIKGKSPGVMESSPALKIEVIQAGKEPGEAGATPKSSCKTARSVQFRAATYAIQSQAEGVCCASCEGITACANCSVWIGCGAYCCTGSCCA